MKTLKTLALFLIGALAFVGCEPVDGGDDKGSSGKGLVIVADKTTIYDNGVDCAPKTAYCDGITLTEGFQLYVGENPIEGNSFSSTEQGTFTIWANYGTLISNEISVNVIKTPPPAPAAIEELNVVEDDVKLEDVEISTEDDASQAQQEAYVPPAVVEEEEESEQQIFTVVETMPEFPGGMGALMQYLAKSIKYPVIAQENGIQGRVTCTFVINKDGSIVDAQVLRGIDPSLDKEALRVINAMPKWSPGKQRGKPVRVKYTVPVMFRLQ